jgi:hypothetical protein
LKRTKLASAKSKSASSFAYVILVACIDIEAEFIAFHTPDNFLSVHYDILLASSGSVTPSIQ